MDQMALATVEDVTISTEIVALVKRALVGTAPDDVVARNRLC
jgi:hypothetical protein